MVRAPASSSLRVYIVEDQALFRECLRAKFELEGGVEVVGEADNGEQALRDLSALDVDVVLMDIGLPGMDGIEATRSLKEIRPELPVVVLTSHENEALGDAIEAGVAGYILKTTTARELMEAVRGAQNGQASIDSSLTGKLFSEVAELRKTRRDSILSPRQLEILSLVAAGERYKEVGKIAALSRTTVNREMRAIFDRLGVNDAAHAVSEAHNKGLL